MRQKILFIINSLTGGGAERVLATLLRHSEPWRDRFDIELALLDEEAQAYPIPHWITVHRLDCNFGLRRSIAQLRRLTDDIRPDVSLSFLTRSNIANAAAMAGSGKPWVISERVNTSAHLGTGPRAWLGRAIVRARYPKADAVIAVSQGVADDLSANFRVSRDRLKVIANPVDAAEIRSLGTDANALSYKQPYIFAMGRLVENKNFSLLIDAFARSGLDGQLVIGGEGPLRAALETQIDSLGLGDRVTLAGFLKNPFAVAAGARFFVLPSNAEGFPNGLVEAMALGKAVISTNCASGPSEILDDCSRDRVHGMVLGRYGILVPPNDPDAMAEAMRQLEDEAQRKRYEAQAAERAREYTPQRAAERYWGVIESVMAVHHAKGL